MLDQKTLRTIFGLNRQEAGRRWKSLTPREREVAEKIAQGWSNKQISQQLKISPKTLDIHRMKVKQKLEAKTTAGIAAVFFVWQLTSTTDQSRK